MNIFYFLWFSLYGFPYIMAKRVFVLFCFINIWCYRRYIIFFNHLLPHDTSDTIYCFINIFKKNYTYMCSSMLGFASHISPQGCILHCILSIVCRYWSLITYVSERCQQDIVLVPQIVDHLSVIPEIRVRFPALKFFTLLVLRWISNVKITVFNITINCFCFFCNVIKWINI